MRQLKALVTLLILGLAISGCAQTYGGGTYKGGQTRMSHTVQYGTVEQISDSVIEDSPSGLGALGGAVVGGVLGNMIGGGKGRVLTTLGGAVAGGAAGYAGEQAMKTKKAIEITVRLENGQVMSVVQEPDETFVVGDRVRILTGNDGSARVRH
ncbi:glycine zipper 2TM domain-containing protein [Nitratidesulfovibrio termitidis]|uniref:glycine zipper 2TM domain-containing protein n=1 Tax=Nitratidesulfovibrio termitidis TaxID=42252 RepID=UPI00041AE865|nr:glycine zipper 2TM domain-containing protein [Nitratidesulfovibrio termitidis]